MTIINQTWNFVFVHVPKTGGTTVSHALSPLCSWRDIELGGTAFGEKMHKVYGQKHKLWKHSWAYEIRDVVGRETWNRMTSFGIVRDPVQRTLSTFRYLLHHCSHYKIMQGIETLEQFLASEAWQDVGPDRMFLPQTKNLCRGAHNEVVVDHVIKLEEFDDQIGPLLRDIGLPQAKVSGLAFDRKNRSPERPGQELSQQHLNMICERYADDFELFGYEPPKSVDEVGGPSEEDAPFQEHRAAAE